MKKTMDIKNMKTDIGRQARFLVLLSAACLLATTQTPVSSYKRLFVSVCRVVNNKTIGKH